MSTAPSVCPSTSTVPSEGCENAAAMLSSVVLPAPFGPRTTQCSPRSTVQFTPCRSTARRSSAATQRHTSTSVIRIAAIVPPLCSGRWVFELDVPVDRRGGDGGALGVGQLDLDREVDTALGVEGGERVGGGLRRPRLRLDRAARRLRGGGLGP